MQADAGIAAIITSVDFEAEDVDQDDREGELSKTVWEVEGRLIVPAVFQA